MDAKTEISVVSTEFLVKPIPIASLYLCNVEINCKPSAEAQTCLKTMPRHSVYCTRSVNKDNVLLKQIMK